MLFVKLPYTLATEEAERIGLDHVARLFLNMTDFFKFVIQYFNRIVSSTDGGESR